MDFENIVLEVFASGDVELTNLDEGSFPLNSTLAYFTLKRNALNKLKNIGGISDKVKKVKKDAKDIKAKGMMAKEQARAEAGLAGGKGENATSYKLTKEQLEVLSQINEKYGKAIIDEVMTFRKNILAPYQIIKRLVKNNKIITSKDKFGMTHSQYKAAIESGMKKILKRGDVFLEKNENSQNILDNLSSSIDALRELKKDFIGTGRLRESLVNRVLKTYDLGNSDFEESLEDLRKTYDELKKNEKLVTGYLVKPSIVGDNPFSAQELIKRNIDLRKGMIKHERESNVNASFQEFIKRNIDLRKGIIKQERESNVNENLPVVESFLKEEADFTSSELFKKNSKFNVALGKYMLRRDIINDLKVEGNNRFKKTYISIIDKMVDQAIERRNEILNKKIKQKSNLEFNEIERKIYKIRPNVKLQYSNKPSDYALAIVDDDFTDPEHVQRPPALIKAEETIEAEIKRFERFLQKELDKEDYDKLKKYRLINNLISVSELSEPDKLFKTPEELRAMKKKEPEQKQEYNNDEEEDTSNYDITQDDDL